MELSTITVKIDKKTKDDAVKVLDELGISQSAVINMLFKQIILKKEVPFELSLSKRKK